jgi:hypothetical protein
MYVKMTGNGTGILLVFLRIQKLHDLASSFRLQLGEGDSGPEYVDIREKAKWSTPPQFVFFSVAFQQQTAESWYTS